MRRATAVSRKVAAAYRRMAARVMTTRQPAQPRGRTTYASYAEDVIALTILNRWRRLREPGFYVDAGAYHPWTASNTALLYGRGWRGINVEPNPFMVEQLRAARPRDITLVQAVGTPRRQADLLVFSDGASSNTLDAEFAERIIEGQGVSIERRIEVDVVPLADLLDEYLPAGEQIDLLNVDVEGMDLEVLKSNDWERYPARLVAVEDIDLRLDDPHSSGSFQFMTELGYRFITHSVITSFYLRLP